MSGSDLASYLDENLLAPLEMKDTFFTVPNSKLPRLAEMYRPTPGGLRECAAWESFRFRNQQNRFYSGGGGLCSTIDDYSNFCRMLLSGGAFNGQQLIGKSILEEAFTNQLKALKNKSFGFKFGLGFRIAGNGDLGWGGAAGTKFWVNPKQNLIVLYMVQIKPDHGSTDGDFLLKRAHQLLDKS